MCYSVRAINWYYNILNYQIIISTPFSRCTFFSFFSSWKVSKQSRTSSIAPDATSSSIRWLISFPLFTVHCFIVIFIDHVHIFAQASKYGLWSWSALRSTVFVEFVFSDIHETNSSPDFDRGIPLLPSSTCSSNPQLPFLCTFVSSSTSTKLCRRDW